MDSGHYNSTHRAFIQALFARSTISFPEAKPILSAIQTAYHDRPVLPNDITYEDFQTMIHTLNAALSPFAYEIRSQHSQTAQTRAPDEARYALVNATSDPQTALATLHSPDEIAFVRRVLDAMFDGPGNSPAREVMAIKAMDALRLGKVPSSTSRRDGAGEVVGGTQVGAGTQASGAPAASLTMERAENMIEKLVEEEWFDRSSAGFLTLSTRSLMELGQWLFDTYNDPVEELRDGDVERAWQRIKTCEGCKQIVTIGQRCTNQACLCRLHDFCVDTFFRGQESRKCPLCRAEWTGRDFVGERAAQGMRSVPTRQIGDGSLRGR